MNDTNKCKSVDSLDSFARDYYKRLQMATMSGSETMRELRDQHFRRFDGDGDGAIDQYEFFYRLSDVESFKIGHVYSPSKLFDMDVFVGLLHI